jgi:hypothetical protein
MKSGIKNGRRTPINLSLTNKINISALSVLTYYRNFVPHYQQDHPNAKHYLYFPVDFSIHSLKQNKVASLAT